MEKASPNSGSVGDVAPPKTMEQTGRANSPSKPLPQRKKLPHEIPSWVEQGSRHFITINCKFRDGNPLIKHAPQLLESARHYEQINKWHLWLMVIMPDHVHFIATFNLSDGLKQTVRTWKSYQARTLDIEWQSGFFEHRLRNTAEFDEKCHYIRNNPVRQNLVMNPEEWPHILDRTSMDGGSPGRFALPNDTAFKGRAKRPAEPKL